MNKDSDGPRVYGEKHSVLIPCGKCDECVKKYQNDWMIRNYFQLKESHYAVFFTLTYRDENLPLGVDGHASVCKDDVQKFLKRFREFRRKRGLSTGFKYYITSEYGPTTLRAHYHGLLHGVHLVEFMEFASVWRKEYGFTTQREVSILQVKSAMNSARYTSKYCSKGDFENPLVALNKVEKNFHLISKGLGQNYLTPQKYAYHLALDFPNKRGFDRAYTDAYLQEIYKRMRVVIDGFAYSLPRFYKEKIFAKRKDLQDAYSDFVCSLHVAEYEAKLAELQAAKQDRTRFQASVILANQDNQDADQRAVDARVKITKSLKQSKI